MPLLYGKRRALISSGKGAISPNQISGMKIWTRPLVGTKLTQGSLLTNGNWATVADNSTMHPGTGDMWVAFWLKSTTSNTGVIGKGRANNTDPGWLIYYQADATMGYIIDDGTQYAFVTNSPIKTFNDGSFHHHIMMVDRHNKLLKVYIDGSLYPVTADITNCGNINSTAQFLLSAFPGPILACNGNFDAVTYGQLAAGTLYLQEAALVSALYNGGNGLKPDDLTSTQKTNFGVVSGWSFSNPNNMGKDYVGTNNLSITGTIDYEEGKIQGAFADSNGELVQTWKDQSTNNIDLSQPNVGQLFTPTFGGGIADTVGLGGHPTVSFAGGNNCRLFNSSANLGSAATLFMVMKIDGTSPSGADLFSNGGSMEAQHIPATPLIRFIAGGQHFDLNCDPTALGVMQFNLNGASSKARYSRGNYTTGSLGADNLNTLSIMSLDDTHQHAIGKIGEIIAYNRVLTDGEATSVMNYLLSEWGL